MAKRKISVEMAKLFAEYLGTVMWLRMLADTCWGEEGKHEFECCEPHKQLKREHDDQVERGVKLAPQTSDAQVLSAAWWRENGFDIDDSDIIF